MVQWRTLFDQKEHAIYSNVLLSGVRAIDLRFCSPDNFWKSIRFINSLINTAIVLLLEMLKEGREGVVTARLVMFPKISYEIYKLTDDQ